MKYQMKRGVSQSLYKYLPESWIDFSVRGEERYNYIAHVTRWNSEKLDGINKQRLIRVVNQAIQAFGNVAGEGGTPLDNTAGYGAGLTIENCNVLNPKHDGDERGIIAEISPKTFYCPKCHHVYQFRDVESYKRNKKCRHCKTVELKQFRQIYFCKCGNATDKHPVYCKKCKSGEHIFWSGKLNDYNFRCTKCGEKIPMFKKCEQCGSVMPPNVALDPAQYFSYSISLIDIIDEKVEKFISETDYGALLTVACWLGIINRNELDDVLENGISLDPEAYKKMYDERYEMFIAAGLDPTSAANAASAVANKDSGSKYIEIVNDLRGKIFTSPESISKVSEAILEYIFVKELEDSSSLDEAKEISKMLNTNANPEEFREIAENRAVSAVQVCGDIPFVSCSYGYTRVKSEPGDGVILHAFKEEHNGIKNIYATKLKTEGVLFEFDRAKILSWLDRNNYVEHDSIPDIDDEKAVKLWFVNNIRPELIKPFSKINPEEAATYYVYNLIHTLSHLLIRSAASMCGLDKNSISEYILPSVPAVLVYCQNSQGFNLGALFNLFEAYFDKWINKTYQGAQKCIFDPICIERYKACTGCLFLNEVSCQHFNHDLDRSLIIGSIDRATSIRHYGFWEE
jgi:hypothetical protein